jgi:hypothetical protein
MWPEGTAWAGLIGLGQPIHIAARHIADRQHLDHDALTLARDLQRLITTLSLARNGARTSTAPRTIDVAARLPECRNG